MIQTVFYQQFEIDGVKKGFITKSEEKRAKNVEIAKEKGYKILKNCKLYPIGRFDRYQHVFYNAVDRAWNSYHDILEGKEQGDSEKAYEWVEKCQRVQGCFDAGYQNGDGVVFVEWEVYKLAKDLIGGYAYRHGGTV